MVRRRRHPNEIAIEYARRLRELLETKDKLVKARLEVSTGPEEDVEGKLARLDQQIAGIEAQVEQLSLVDS
jgi:hypothetical protein